MSDLKIDSSVIPAATSADVGGIKIGYTGESYAALPLKLDENNRAYIELNSGAIAAASGAVGTFIYALNSADGILLYTYYALSGSVGVESLYGGSGWIGLKKATNNELGGIKISGKTTTNEKLLDKGNNNFGVILDISDIAFVGIPNASLSTLGLVLTTSEVDVEEDTSYIPCPIDSDGVIYYKNDNDDLSVKYELLNNNSNASDLTGKLRPILTTDKTVELNHSGIGTIYHNLDAIYNGVFIAESGTLYAKNGLVAGTKCWKDTNFRIYPNAFTVQTLSIAIGSGLQITFINPLIAYQNYAKISNFNPSIMLSGIIEYQLKFSISSSVSGNLTNVSYAMTATNSISTASVDIIWKNGLIPAYKSGKTYIMSFVSFPGEPRVLYGTFGEY